jgi:hypothetical protein
MNEREVVWIVHGKHWQYICATEKDAHRLVAELGMNTPSLYPNVTAVMVLKYETEN